LCPALTVELANDNVDATNQDRARVAGGQEHEVRYEAEKTGRSKREVKEVIKTVGNSRKKGESELGR
jgi:hypothetical protein